MHVSIMLQPEDGVTALFPRIGDYDKWAIKWGIPILKTLKDEAGKRSVVEQMTKEAYKNNRLFWI
jgi:hypothetical protein